MANQGWRGAAAAGGRALLCGGGDGGGGEELGEDNPKLASCGMYKPQPHPLRGSRADTSLKLSAGEGGLERVHVCSWQEKPGLSTQCDFSVC